MTRAATLAALSCAALFAAPRLRLETTSVGPLSIATGQNGDVRTIGAYNIGDGTLNLTLTSNATWLTAAVSGPAVPCGFRAGNCLPVALRPQTAALARGTYTGTVTISDPNAVDAPQTIVVTVNIGGGVPERIEGYARPGGAATATFTTNSELGLAISTQQGGDWLSTSSEGGGTFRFTIDYRVRMNAANLPEGTYNGQIVTSRSRVADENRTVPVVLRVTAQPIIQASAARVRFRLAQGAGDSGPSQFVVLSNAGAGTLNVSGATVAAGADWLRASIVQGVFLQLDARVGALAPGRFNTTVQVNSNAANPLTIPVELELQGATPPTLFLNGAVNNANFAADDPLAQGAIVSLFGEHMLFAAPIVNTNASQLPTEMGGTRVLVNGQPVPLYFASYGQINFQMPFDAPAGGVTVQVERGGQRGNLIGANVTAIAPRILRFGEYGIIVNPDGSLAAPRGSGTRPVRRGETVVIYMIGGGQTTPSAQTGAAVPGDQLRPVRGDTVVTLGNPSFGGRVLPTIFGGLTPGFVGLYQVNVTIPEDAPSGERIPLRVRVGANESAAVSIAIE